MPAPTETFDRWDVVAVPFPNTEANQRRPAVVVSTRRLAERHGLTWLVMVTSADNPCWPDDVVIADPARAGLPHPSIVRPVKLATVQHDRVLRRLGSLGPEERRAVTAAIARQLA